MNKQFGFTLAEVLITLVIIGVVAALTIPTLINNTNGQAYRSSLKKAISMLNQGITANYSLNATTVADYSSSAQNLRDSLFKQSLSIINTSNAANALLGGSTAIFYTADGMKFGIVSNAGGAYTCSMDDTGPCYDVYIDVNGDRAPNTLTSQTTNPKDIYTAQIFVHKIVPSGAVTQGIVYDQ